MNAGRDAEAKKVPEPPGKKIPKMAVTPEPALSLKDRKNFKEVRRCYSDEQAEREVSRCMTCGSKAFIAYPEDCMVCFNCELQCPREAIDVAYTPVPMPPMIRIAKGVKNG